MNRETILAVLNRAQDEVKGKVSRHSVSIGGMDDRIPVDVEIHCPYRAQSFDVVDELDDYGHGSGNQLCGGCGHDVSDDVSAEVTDMQAAKADLLVDSWKESGGKRDEAGRPVLN